MSYNTITQALETRSERFENRFERCIDTLETRMHNARQSRFVRVAARVAAVLLTALLLLASFLFGTAGLLSFSSVCAVAGAVLGTLGLLLLFIFPSGE